MDWKIVAALVFLLLLCAGFAALITMVTGVIFIWVFLGLLVCGAIGLAAGYFVP